MKRIHRQEKEQFKKLFSQENVVNIDDRIKVLNSFLQTEQHVTATELTVMLNENGYQLGLDFVRDTLQLLCFYGFAQKNRFDNGHDRYEHRHLSQHHDHMICTRCRRIFEFQNDQLELLQQQIAQSSGFHMLQHKMEIYGICSECRQQRVAELSLAMAKPGEKLQIKSFIGGTGARLRLLTMGLRIGDELEVITNGNNGQVVIAVDYNRYSLGRGLAQKIVVQSVDH